MLFAVRRELLHHEVRVLGIWLFALPVLVAAIFAIAVGMMAFKQADPSDISNMVMTALEGAVPLVTGITVATVASQESALELQLTVLMPYRLTVLQRIALLVIWSSLIEALAVAILVIVSPWVLKKQGIGYLLTWLAPLLWFSAWGAILALLLRSRAASVAILGVVWVIELLFHSTLATYGWTRALDVFATMFDSAEAFWGANRIDLLVTALILFVVVWLYLRNSEWRLRGEDT